MKGDSMVREKGGQEALASLCDLRISLNDDSAVMMQKNAYTRTPRKGADTTSVHKIRFGHEVLENHTS